jgi:hypothetical protein
MISANEARELTDKFNPEYQEELARIEGNIIFHAQQGRRKYYYRGIGPEYSSGIQRMFYTSENDWGQTERRLQQIMEELRANGYTVEEYQRDGQMASDLCLLISW